MTDKSRRDVLRAVGGVAVVGVLAGCTGSQEGSGAAENGSTEADPGVQETETEGDAGTETETEMETESDTMDGVMLRVAHLSPDAPNVDVLVDGSAVLEDVPFGAVSDYLSVAPGTYQVTVQAAGDPETVVFDESLDLAAGAYTAAAVGELEEGAENGFAVQLLTDDVSAPMGDMARVRVVHASPDAPAVDVTVASSGDVLVDGAAFGDAATVEVPAGDYTLDIRGDTESNDGDVVASYDVTVESGMVYTAFAQGYLTPDDEPTDAAFDLQVVVDN